MRYLVDTTIGDINILVRALKRYNKKGLVYLIFTIIPLLRSGEFNDEKIINNSIYIPFDKGFEHIYGKIHIEYYIDDNKIGFVLSDKIKYVLLSLYRFDSDIIDGIPIIDDTALFKYRVYKSILNNRKED